MSDKAKPYTLGDMPDEMSCTDCGEPDCCLMEEQSRIHATVEECDALRRLLSRTLDNCKFWSDDFKDEVRDAIERKHDQDD